MRSKWKIDKKNTELIWHRGGECFKPGWSILIYVNFHKHQDFVTGIIISVAHNRCTITVPKLSLPSHVFPKLQNHEQCNHHCHQYSHTLLERRKPSVQCSTFLSAVWLPMSCSRITSLLKQVLHCARPIMAELSGDESLFCCGMTMKLILPLGSTYFFPLCHKSWEYH